MGVDSIIKEILRDVEKLKEAGTSSEIIDEITVFTIPPTLDISGTVRGVNEFSISPVVSPVISTVKNQFAISPAISPVLGSVEQATGSFLVGTAQVGFSDAG